MLNNHNQLIDIEQLGAKLRISSDSIYAVLKTFHKCIPLKIQELCLFASNDLNDYRILIHGLKGSLGNIGIEDLSGMASQLEKAAVSRDLSYINENNPIFVNKLDMLNKTLEVYLASYIQNKRTENTHTVTNNYELTSLLKDAVLRIDLLQNLDAIDVLNIIIDNDLCKDAEKISDIITALENYNYKSALEIITEIQQEAIN